ncbi:hypothetical protein HBB16_17365 [Pseudonocardia sp. MCCB 268]|nr:hypothetical protein [Pseudonocardia cytotoxica]
MIVRARPGTTPTRWRVIRGSRGGGGTIGAEGPVDVDARAQWYRNARSRKAGAGGRNGSWRDDGEVVGTARAQEMGDARILGLGMALLPRVRAAAVAGRPCSTRSSSTRAPVGCTGRARGLDGQRPRHLTAPVRVPGRGSAQPLPPPGRRSLRSTLLMAYLIEDRGWASADRRSRRRPQASRWAPALLVPHVPDDVARPSNDASTRARRRPAPTPRS